MRFNHDEYEFDIGSERYRHDSGQYLAGPPQDFDTKADRFRDVHGENKGQFKSHSSFGPDDERSSGPEIVETDGEFGGSSKTGFSDGDFGISTQTEFSDRDSGSLGDVGVRFDGL